MRDNGHDYQLELWENGAWRVASWLGKKGFALPGLIRINDFGEPAFSVWTRSGADSLTSHVEIRHMDRFGRFHTFGQGQVGSRIERLEITNSDGSPEWRYCKVRRRRLPPGVSASLRQRRYPPPGGGFFGGIGENGAWGGFSNRARIYSGDNSDTRNYSADPPLDSSCALATAAPPGAMAVGFSGSVRGDA